MLYVSVTFIFPDLILDSLSHYKETKTDGKVPAFIDTYHFIVIFINIEFKIKYKGTLCIKSISV